MRLTPIFLLLSLVACANSLPQTACTADPKNTTKALTDACRARAALLEFPADGSVVITTTKHDAAVAAKDARHE